MDALQTTALALGGGWASGLNLYLTAAALGIAHRMHWIVLPGSLDTLANPIVIFFLVLLYIIEFVIDKIPYLDSAWDSVHTLIRPVGGALLASMAFDHSPDTLKYAVAAIAGAASLNAHLGKAGSRVVINTSPEPFSNSAASVAEDGIVIGMLWLIFKHPVLALIVVALFAALIIWMIPKIFRFIKKFFQMMTGKRKEEPALAVPVKEHVDSD